MGQTKKMPVRTCTGCRQAKKQKGFDSSCS